jgi:membrane associated rhomboid family serine protease
MTAAPVGLRCPDHATAAGRARGGPARAGRRLIPPATQRRLEGTPALVTRILIAINVGIYVITAAQGAGINSPGGKLFTDMLLFGPFVAQGDWWRLITAAFLHGSLLHIAFNMLALWWFGAPVEEYLGRTRFVLLYLVSGLAGSAGALLQSPATPVVGASGAIFGILGAMLILEWQATGRLGGNAATLIVINLAIGFTISNVSIGGHIGGLIGGILGTLAFARFGKGHAAYGRVGLTGAAGLLIVGAASILIAYWQVRGYA